MISNEKKAILHIAKGDLARRVGFTDDDYRTILFDEAKVTSSVYLDNAGFERVMERLRKLGFSAGAPKASTRRARRPTNVIGLVTARQKWRIEQNYNALGFDTPARREGFNRRQCGKSEPRTVGDGRRVIDGQEALLRRQREGATIK